jgi:hypothetical protein
MQHSGGAASVIKSRGIKPPASLLERRILATLRGPVVWQSLFLEQSFFSDAEWEALVNMRSDEAVNNEEGFFEGMASMVRLFQRTRSALSRSPRDPKTIKTLAVDVQALKVSLDERSSQLGANIDRMCDLPLAHPTGKDMFQWLTTPRNYGLLLPVRIMLNCITMSLHGQSLRRYEDENKVLCHAACNVAAQAVAFRPLGSLWVGLMLMMSYPGAREEAEQERLKYWMVSYSNDLQHSSVSPQDIDLDIFGRYLRCEDLLSGGSDEIGRMCKQ